MTEDREPMTCPECGAEVKHFIADGRWISLEAILSSVLDPGTIKRRIDHHPTCTKGRVQ